MRAMNESFGSKAKSQTFIAAIITHFRTACSKQREYAIFYCRKHFKRSQTFYSMNDEGPDIIIEVIKNTRNKMKRGKATGEDGISIEMIEALNDSQEKFQKISILYHTQES